jgi:iron complex transport system permease protein
MERLRCKDKESIRKKEQPRGTTIAQLQRYKKHVLRKRMALLIALAATFGVALVAAGIGSYNIPITEIIKTLLGMGEATSQTVILGIRIPRVVTALVVGGILASSGAVMQCVLRNPLASSSTLGVSQGAAFGAAIGIVFFAGGSVNSSTASSAVTIQNPYIVTLFAFLGGFVSTAVIIGISQFRKDIGPGGLVLAGVALSAIFSGGSTLLQYFVDETKLGTIVFWTFGDVGSSDWIEILILAVVFVGAMVYFMLNRWNYNAMESGADTAKSLGVNTRAVMLISMAISSAIASVAVAFCGIISFVGLIAPHMMRRFTGNDYRYLIPGSAITGALLLVLADTFARVIIMPVILPIGAITSFLGGPMFLYLLFKGASKR